MRTNILVFIYYAYQGVKKSAPREAFFAFAFYPTYYGGAAPWQARARLLSATDQAVSFP